MVAAGFDIVNFHYSRGNWKERRFELLVERMMIESGVVTSVTGPSGSGKTTLFDLLAGVIGSPLNVEVRGIFPNIAYIMHESALMGWRTVSYNYVLECKLRRVNPDLNRFRELLERCQLQAAVLNRQVAELSFGMRQRAELSRALALKPDLLILDEGLSGLDRALKLTVFRLIMEQVEGRGMAVVLTSHFLTDVLTFSNRIYRIREGAVNGKVLEIKVPIADRLALNETELFLHKDVRPSIHWLS